MKTRLFLSLVACGSIAHAQTAPVETAPLPSAPETQAPFFRDVPPNHWAFAAVQRLAGAGIVKGFPAPATPQKIADSNSQKPVIAAAKPMAVTKAISNSQKMKDAKAAPQKINVARVANPVEKR